MEGENTAKAVLKPRNPGENIKVAETVLKRRDRNLKAAAERAAKFAKVRRENENYKKGKIQIVRAEKLVKNHLVRIKDRRRLKWNDKKKPNPKPSDRSQMVVAVRNGRLGGVRDVKRCLRTMGLNKRNTLVFLPNTNETAKKLLKVKPFVYWGKTAFKTAFNLIHKKAIFKDPATPTEKILLSDNVLIEKHLGEFGVLCTEDLAHVLHTRGKHFKEVARRLWAIPVGNVKRANGMVKDEKWTFGDQRNGMDAKVKKLIGE